jgi:hypothetical protein
MMVVARTLSTIMRVIFGIGRPRSLEEDTTEGAPRCRWRFVAAHRIPQHARPAIMTSAIATRA